MLLGLRGGPPPHNGPLCISVTTKKLPASENLSAWAPQGVPHWSEASIESICKSHQEGWLCLTASWLFTILRGPAAMLFISRDACSDIVLQPLSRLFLLWDIAVRTIIARYIATWGIAQMCLCEANYQGGIAPFGELLGTKAFLSKDGTTVQKLERGHILQNRHFAKPPFFFSKTKTELLVPRID